MKSKKILYFISGRVPSNAEVQQAEAMGASFRNRQFIRPKDNPEACDEVYGEKIPEPYKGKPIAQLPEGFKLAPEGKKESGGTEEPDNETDALKAELDRLGVPYRANAKVETLKAKLAEAEAEAGGETDPTA